MQLIVIFRNIILLSLVLVFFKGKSQDTQPPVTIRVITIEGNKHTKEPIILRELSFIEGDTISGEILSLKIEKSRTNLINLNLFGKIVFNIKNWENDSLDIVISLTERNRFKFAPIFNLADRNFNIWWTDQNRSFKRVQGGALVRFNNAFGLNHTIIGTATFGFAQIFDLEYRMPYINKAKTLGAQYHFEFSQSKQVQYGTTNDKQDFFEGEKFVNRKIELGTKLVFRPKIHNTNTFTANYLHYEVDNTLANQHPTYLLNGRTTVNFFQIGYMYEIDLRDFRYFPKKGLYFRGELQRNGFGIFKNDINLTRFSLSLSKYEQIGKSQKHLFSHAAKIMLSGPENQPYVIQRGMGFKQDFVRGNELFQIDGQRFLLIKNEYKYALLDVKLNYLKKLKGKKLGYMPLSLYLGGHFDCGVVTDKANSSTNSLRNKLIYGYGIGLNMVTFYDKVLRLEYSFNQDFNKGFYIHFEVPI